jgi:alpha-beta hydrolase superfamily lysophospholipase
MFLSIIVTFVMLLSVLGLMLWLGKPAAPKPMASIAAPFRSVDYSDLPPVQFYPARDGAKLAYRHYGTAKEKPLGVVVLVHGSSAKSSSMHPLAKALSAAGWESYALDIRGHGESGEKGKVAYVGQLEDDLQDFMNKVSGSSPKMLIGFSSGGGFALRVAGSERQNLFDGYLLLSPFLSPEASTSRKDSGGWVGVGIPRIIALILLNKWGVRIFNNLPVLAFALSHEDAALLTPAYSYNLWASFQPHDDYKKDILLAKKPMAVLEGAEDEVFNAERFAVEFGINDKVQVTLVPGLNHVGLVLNPRGIQAISEALDRLRQSHKP